MFGGCPSSSPVRTSNARELMYDVRLKAWLSVAAGPPPRISVAPSRVEIDALKRTRRGIKSFLAKGPPPPGGLGGGVSFLPGQVLFQSATAVSFFLAAPANLGDAPTADLLYMTSSNRASKGCEALISYFKVRAYSAAFMIWDWAHPEMPDQSKFVVTRTYEELTPYLIPLTVSTPSGSISFDSLQITNSTRNAGDAWINEVFLHNNTTGERERVWQYAYQWPTKATDPDFWWGPIFETFPDDAQYASAPALGFADAILLQDGIVHSLDSSDSSLSEPTDHGLITLWETPNSGLIASGVSQASKR
jgi:hypothetical protein